MIAKRWTSKGSKQRRQKEQTSTQSKYLAGCTEAMGVAIDAMGGLDQHGRRDAAIDSQLKFQSTNRLSCCLSIQWSSNPTQSQRKSRRVVYMKQQEWMMEVVMIGTVASDTTDLMRETKNETCHVQGCHTMTRA
jgi:hypothetical protein